MLYSKGGIYHAICHWYIAIYKVVYTLLFNTAPLLCYKLFNTARCYVTSYLTLLYNMLNHTFWPERALPACLSPVARALILLWLSEFFCISEFVFAFQKTQVIFVQIKITSMQNVQLDKTNILLSCLLILDKYNLSSGKIKPLCCTYGNGLI